jgi:hypothetical protein
MEIMQLDRSAMRRRSSRKNDVGSVDFRGQRVDNL